MQIAHLPAAVPSCFSEGGSEGVDPRQSVGVASLLPQRNTLNVHMIVVHLMYSTHTRTPVHTVLGVFGAIEYLITTMVPM